MSSLPETASPLIREMRPADLAVIVAIEERNYGFPWSRVVFSDCLMAGYLCVVLEVDGRVVGYTILSTAAAEAHILNLCVDPDFQRRGLGRRLLDYLLGYARDVQIERLFLEVRPSNIAAIELYTRADFVRLGLRKSYYQAENGQREDALVLMRDFG